MTRRRPRSVAVVGGSLGGLSAAGWLAARGADVHVYERSPVALEGRGAGIVLHPQTSALLTEVHGIALDDFSIAVDEVGYLDRDGTWSHVTSGRYRFVGWERLYRLLLDTVAPERYVLDARIDRVENSPDGVVLACRGGEIAADFALIADGAASTLRDRIAGHVVRTDAGYLAWRGTVDVDARHEHLLTRITYAIVDDGHLLAYPIARHYDGGVLNWLWYRTVPPGPRLEAMLTDVDGRRREASVPAHLVDPAQVRCLRSDAEAILPKLLAKLVAATDSPFVQLIGDVEVDRTVSGRRCLLGDAAFVARPHAAAGTAKAASEGRMFAEAICGSADVVTALQRVQHRQMAQARDLIARSAAAGHHLQIARDWPAGRELPFGLTLAGDSQFTS